MAYNGTIELIAGITQKNGGTFPLVDASAIRVDDNMRLDERLTESDALSYLSFDEIPNTVQNYTFNNDGSVSQVTHIANNETIRTDTFTYGVNTITEVRTLNTFETLTIVTNLTTLETSVTLSTIQVE